MLRETAHKLIHAKMNPYRFLEQWSGCPFPLSFSMISWNRVRNVSLVGRQEAAQPDVRRSETSRAPPNSTALRKDYRKQTFCFSSVFILVFRLIFFLFCGVPLWPVMYVLCFSCLRKERKKKKTAGLALSEDFHLDFIFVPKLFISLLFFLSSIWTINRNV